jgi:hypothetical protein
MASLSFVKANYRAQIIRVSKGESSQWSVISNQPKQAISSVGVFAFN